MKIKLINGIGLGLGLSTFLTTNVSADVEDKVITLSYLSLFVFQNACLKFNVVKLCGVLRVQVNL